jgi:hypothetical protein
VQTFKKHKPATSDRAMPQKLAVVIEAHCRRGVCSTPTVFLWAGSSDKKLLIQFVSAQH